MPIDSRIALGYQAPQIESPVNMMMAAQKMQSGQQENQLRQFQMQQMQQEAERTNQLRQTLSGIDLTTPEGQAQYGRALFQTGNVKEGQEYAASVATRTKAEREADLAKLTLGTTRTKIVAAEAGALMQDPTLDFSKVQSWAATHATDGFITPAAMQNLQAMQNARPEELRAALGRLQQQAVDADKQIELQQKAIPPQGQEFTFFNSLTPEQQTAYTAFRNAGKPPGQTVNVNSYLPASEEAQRDFIKSTRATYDQLKSVPATLQNMAKARALIPGSKDFMGTGGEPLLNAASFLNNRLGTNIKIEGVKDATTLRSVLFSGVLDNLRKLDAQPTAGQQNILQQALGSIGTDPSALSNVLDAYEDILRDKVDLHNQEVQSSVQRGVKFPYDPTIKLPPRREAPPAANRGTAGGPAGAPTVVRTGTAKDGRKVVELSDGTFQFQ